MPLAAACADDLRGLGGRIITGQKVEFSSALVLGGRQH